MTQPIRQELHLLTNTSGKRVFVAGEDGCTHIEHLPGGAGYEVHQGPKLIKVPEHRVEHFEQDPRPGYELEQANQAKGLPSFVKDVGDGSFGCQRCGRLGFKSVHSVKVHFGKEHSGDRDG
jgi:hypothetical protein